MSTKKIIGIIALTIFGILIVLCLVGGIGVAMSGDDDPTPSRTTDQPTTQPTTQSPTPTPTTKPTTKPTPTRTTNPPTSPPPPIIVGAGTYRVGEDIPAGQYKVVERAGGDCYWARTKGDDIIDNSLAGGFPQFNAKKGEDLEIGESCPDFKRVGK